MGDILSAAFSPQLGFAPVLNEAVSGSLFSAGLSMFSAQTGDLRRLHPELDFHPSDGPPLTAIGAGCDFDPETAKRKAAYEAVERHAAAVYDPADVVFAAAEELGSDALPLDVLPELSTRSPASRLRPARPRLPPP